mmetsp:Transcript_54025/g.58569  ORF Transcript_54025/g.58569 Transcript_54025/m.58569 type:complete len:328 (-) Transcript_54025:134-1117(-)
MSDDDKERPLVVITGVTGYLGSQVCLTFLEDGSFRVRGTVRNVNSKMSTLREGFSDEHMAQLDLVEADLNDEVSIISACEGATYIVHTASPFHFQGDCVTPAVNGTSAIMKACSTHQDTLKLCVLTSSCAAVMGPAKEDQAVPPAKYNESYWSNPDRPGGMMDYMKSKTLAEKTAWDYQAANPGFDLVTICPTFIMGPAPCGQGTSVEWLTKAMDGSKSEVPRGKNGFVDVRDVALAHLRAIQIPEAANKRFILYHEKVLLPELYGWLSKFNAKGAKVPTTLAEGEDEQGGDLVDNTRSQQVLHIDYTPSEKTFTDHAEQLISMGAI